MKLHSLRLLVPGCLRLLVLGAACFMLDVLVLGQQTPPLTPDIPPKFETPTSADDYVKRVAMIPMRDAVKLYTVIVLPKGARNAPILLTRTPYNTGAGIERPRRNGRQLVRWFHRRHGARSSPPGVESCRP